MSLQESAESDRKTATLAEDDDDEPVFAIHELNPPTEEEQLESYVMYLETGGRPFEPMETLLREQRARGARPSEQERAA